MSELGDVLLRAKIQHFLWQKEKLSIFNKKNCSRVFHVEQFCAVYIGYPLQINHLYCCDCCFYSFVSVLASTPIYGLLESIIGKHTEDYWNILGGIQVGYPIGNSLADKVKVLSLSLYHTTYDNYGIHSLLYSYA